MSLDSELIRYLNAKSINPNIFFDDRFKEMFKVGVGSIDEGGKDTVDIIVNIPENPIVLAGVLTDKKYPFFKFLFSTKDKEFSVYEEDLGVLESFEKAYNSIEEHLPCVTFEMKKKHYLIYMDTYSKIFVFDYYTTKPTVFDKYVLKQRKIYQGDENLCKELRNTKVNFEGYLISPKEYLMSRYLTELYKLVRIYHLNRR